MSTNVQPALSGIQWELIENNLPISCSDIHCSSMHNMTQHQHALHSHCRTAAVVDSIRRRVASELSAQATRRTSSLCLSLRLDLALRPPSWKLGAAAPHRTACICLLAILISAALSHFSTAEPTSTLLISLTSPSLSPTTSSFYSTTTPRLSPLICRRSPLAATPTTLLAYTHLSN